MHRPPHPVHAVLLSGTVPLFLGVFLSDMAYASTYEIQWKNFASWLLVGGLLFAGFALLWALVELARFRPLTSREAIYPSLLLALWVLGFIDALVHASDAWASMPTAPVLSTLVAALAIAATAVRFHKHQAVVAP